MSETKPCLRAFLPLQIGECAPDCPNGKPATAPSQEGSEMSMAVQDTWEAQAKRATEDCRSLVDQLREQAKTWQEREEEFNVLDNKVDALQVQLREKTEEIDRLKKPCRCGSGGHPRYCERHPEWQERHVFEINYENAIEAEAEAKAELATARAEVKRLKYAEQQTLKAWKESQAEVKRLDKVVLAFEDSTGWSADQVTKTNL